PSTLFADPPKYRKISPDSGYNEYYLINAEGYGPHGVKTGFGFQERSEVVAAVAKLLGLEPSKGVALDPDDDIRITRLDKPLPMFTASEIADKKFVRKTNSMTKEQHAHENQLARQNLALDALRRAANGRPIQLYILWNTQDSYEMVYQT